MRIKLLQMLVAVAMALLVPLQGVAGVSAGLCMALGHHETTGAAHDHGSDHGDGAIHQHHFEASGAEGADHQDDSAGTEKTAGKAHCPPCVACCAAAAITSFTPGFVPEASSAFAIAAIPPSFSGIWPETLDRPPLAL